MPSFKDILELIKKGSTIEAQEMIMDLREEHLRLREEVVGLREANRQLREQALLSGAMRFEAPHYWLERDGQRDGPFCPLCWDRDKRQIRLLSRQGGDWHCNCCERFYPDATYREPRSSVRRVRFDD